MSWHVQGSYVLDKLFGVDRSADIDIFYNDQKPDENIVTFKLKCNTKPLDIYQKGLEPKFNIDYILVNCEGNLTSVRSDIDISNLMIPLELTVVDTAYLNVDDCIRLLKTYYKYKEFLIFPKALEQNIKQNLVELAENFLGDIVENVLHFMPQKEIYMQVRDFIISCNLHEIANELPPM